MKYAITVSDKEGNTAVGYGDYVVSLGGDAPNATNTSAPGTSAPIIPSLPNEGVFIGIAVLALAAFAAAYYFNKKKGGEIAPPPIAPPQLPPLPQP